MTTFNEIEIVEFFKQMRSDFFIEVEGKLQNIEGIIKNYNSTYSENIDINTDGIICLKSNANKWGLEYRLYFNYKEGLQYDKITKNTKYRPNYAFRINNEFLIKKLFESGFRIGKNGSLN